MKVFHCGRCQSVVFFENVQCVHCNWTLGYVPGAGQIASLEPLPSDSGVAQWRPINPPIQKNIYRLCKNYGDEHVCNWVVPADDTNDYCLSCRLTRKIPDLSVPEHRQLWGNLETAKRRLIYGVLQLKLPLTAKEEDPETGVAFEFLADGGVGSEPVLTGHNNGVIVVNVAEADDTERERRKAQLHEPYRTLLGHFRHEIGHYYWDRLIQGTDWLEPFRAVFGDEREEYHKSLERYYQSGPPVDWQARFVSAYAASHPWEDWAETWAHVLHITDTLETAFACGISLKPRRSDEPSIRPTSETNVALHSFDQLIQDWYPLTYVLNNLNRGMGRPDAYPFVLSAPAVEKLRFVHQVISEPRPAAMTAAIEKSRGSILKSA